MSIGGFGYSQEQRRGGLVSDDQQPASSRHGWEPPGVPQNKGTPTMGLFTKDIKTMNDLFVHQLQDIYYAKSSL